MTDAALKYISEPQEVVSATMRFNIMADIVFPDWARAELGADELEMAGYSVLISDTVFDLYSPAAFVEAEHSVVAANEEAAMNFAFDDVERLVAPFGGYVDEAGIRQPGERPFARYEK